MIRSCTFRAPSAPSPLGTRTPRPQPILLVYSSPRPTPHKRRRILSILLLFLLRTMPSPRPLAVCTFPSAPCIALRRIRTCRNQICPPNDRPCTTISTHTSQPTPGQATELQQPRPHRCRRCLRRPHAVIGARACCLDVGEYFHLFLSVLSSRFISYPPTKSARCSSVFLGFVVVVPRPPYRKTARDRRATSRCTPRPSQSGSSV